MKRQQVLKNLHLIVTVDFQIIQFYKNGEIMLTIKTIQLS